VTIQITQRIGRALNVSSATRLKDLDAALREFVRSVGQGATVPLTGTLPYSSLTGVPATFAPSAHTHPNGDLTGYTAADVLSKLLTVDGAGSGLDADLLDGQSSAAFAAAPTTGTWTAADNSGAGLALTTVDARYWKLGTLVIASARIDYPGTASGAAAKVSGLPFAVNANASSQQGFVTWQNSAITLQVRPNVGGITFDFFNAAGAGAAATNAQLSAAAVWLTLIYQT
jgi:hypothetical protein